MNVLDLNGSAKGKMELPRVFSAAVRPDLVQRAVLALQAAKRQPYGSDLFAGKRTSAHYYGVKDKRGSMKNREVARGPRVTGGSPGQEWQVKFVPHARGGRAPHPPKVVKVLTLKINRKENRLALASSIAATALNTVVAARGHKIAGLELPLIVTDEIQTLRKASKLREAFVNLNLEQELARTSDSSIRAGRGKMRGRKYRTKTGVLIVIAKDEGVRKAACNIPGVSVSTVAELNVEMLAPGTQPGRLTVWSEGAIKQIGERFG